MPLNEEIKLWFMLSWVTFLLGLGGAFSMTVIVVMGIDDLSFGFMAYQPS